MKEGYVNNFKYFRTTLQKSSMSQLQDMNNLYTCTAIFGTQPSPWKVISLVLAS